MTLPRELSLAKVGSQYVLKSKAVEQLESLAVNHIEEASAKLPKTVDGEIVSQAEISFDAPNATLKLVFSNSENDSLQLSYDAKTKTFSIDRTSSGLVDFDENFSKEIHQIKVHNIQRAPLNFKIYTDQSSVEIFINDGIYAFTEIFFPKKPFNKLQIFGEENKEIENFTVKKMRAIW